MKTRPLSELATLVDVTKIVLRRCNAEFFGWPSGPETIQYSLHNEARAVRAPGADSILRIQTTHRVQANVEGQPESPLLAIEVEFLLDYALAGEMTEEEKEHFAKLNGLHNAWPYLRELLQSLTTRMGLPPLTIRSFRIGPAVPREKPLRPPLEGKRARAHAKSAPSAKRRKGL